jgi:hypothetical protein
MRRSIPRIAVAIAAGAVAVALYAAPAAAQRASRSMPWGGEFSVQIDSDDGVLPTYHHGGYTYVEGRRGLRYSIRITNSTGERVEAVVTVDGRDVITGRQGNYRRQRGYVIEPYGSVSIDGFRTSWSGVAAFRFTDVEDSYASRLGDDSDVGVIGVAIFREEERHPVPMPIYEDDEYYRSGRLGSAHGKAAPSPPASGDAAGGYAARERSEQGIGTGYGEDQYSPASETSFERRSRKPDAKLAIYYDDHEGLIARGIIRRYYPPPPRPYEPNPFPYNNDPGFAPPPPPRPYNPYYYWE